MKIAKCDIYLSYHHQNSQLARGGDVAEGKADLAELKDSNLSFDCRGDVRQTIYMMDQR